MERILRYHTTINRQLFQATNKLERLHSGSGRICQRHWLVCY